MTSLGAIAASRPPMAFNEEAASVRPPFPFDRIRREGVDIFGDRYFSFNLEEDKIRRHEAEEDEGVW